MNVYKNSGSIRSRHADLPNQSQAVRSLNQALEQLQSVLYSELAEIEKKKGFEAKSSRKQKEQITNALRRIDTVKTVVSQHGL